MITKIMIKTEILLINIILLTLSVAYTSYCQDPPTYTYEKSVLINFDYTFNNEALNKPIQVRENPKTKEIVVLDNGNNCLYTFTQEGKFVRKTGRAGQGPGDLLKPAYFTIDASGNIYVYEEGNLRISIFDYKGKYVNSFKVDRILQHFFSVTPEGELLISHPHNGYYLTVYSKDGKSIKHIGEITDKNRDINFKNPYDAASYQGFPIKLSNGNYCIFLETLYYIKIFKEPDILVKDITYDKVFPNRLSYKEYIKLLNVPEIETAALKKGIRPPPIMTFSPCDIIYNNNKIYYASYKSESEKLQEQEYSVFLYVLNDNLNIEQKIVLTKVEESFNPRQVLYKYGFDVLSSNTSIVYPSPNTAEIYLYKRKK